jgi:hypothetical protein
MDTIAQGIRKLTGKIKQLDKRTKIIILAAIAVIVVGLVIFAVVDNRQKAGIIDNIQAVSPQFESRGDTVPDILLRRLDYAEPSADGLDLRNFDVEVIARSGDWAAVHAISKQLSNYGNQLYAIYQKEGDQYNKKLAGSIITPEQYEQYAVPNGIINGINNHVARGSDSRLRTILSNSPDKTYPIINSLPIGNSFYRITPHFSDQADINSFYLYVDADYGYSNAAIFNLINAGFDPADYKIVFRYDVVTASIGVE